MVDNDMTLIRPLNKAIHFGTNQFLIYDFLSSYRLSIVTSALLGRTA